MLRFKKPRNNDRMEWTRHCIEKMRFYKISEATVKNILWNPKRTEEGIAPGTCANMRSAGSLRRPQEIWVMYQSRQKKAMRLISAWRYPGVTKPRDPLPIPPGMLEEINAALRD